MDRGGTAAQNVFRTLKEGTMLTKKTAKNQLTLPKAIVARFQGVEYFDVSSEGDAIVLRPLRRSQADAARERLAEMGISEKDVDAAVTWARRNP